MSNANQNNSLTECIIYQWGNLEAYVNSLNIIQPRQAGRKTAFRLSSKMNNLNQMYMGTISNVMTFSLKRHALWVALMKHQMNSLSKIYMQIMER